MNIFSIVIIIIFTAFLIWIIIEKRREKHLITRVLPQMIALIDTTLNSKGVRSGLCWKHDWQDCSHLPIELRFNKDRKDYELRKRLRLIKEFKKNNSLDLLLTSKVDFSRPDDNYVLVGLTDNKDFEKQNQKYHGELPEYFRQAEIIQREKLHILKTNDGIAYQHVIKEEALQGDRIECPECHGYGGNYRVDIGAYTCPTCYGQGRIDYIPKINEEERQMFEKVKIRIDELDNNLLKCTPEKPEKDYQVFARINTSPSR